MDKTLRFGVIGCGGIANLHIQNLKKIPGTAVTALASGNRERLLKTAESVPGAALYEDGAKLIQNEDLDGLLICATPFRHEGLELLAAEKGIHLYVEKPLGLDPAAVAETEAAIQKAGILASVGYQERYNPALHTLRERIKGEKIGLVTAGWIGSMPGPLWWRQKAMSGGQIVEQCTHILDLLRFLFGEVASVSGASVTGLMAGVPLYDIEDASAAVLKFKNGMAASLTTACYLEDEGIPDVGFTIHCGGLRVRYDWSDSLSFKTAHNEEVIRFGRGFHFEAIKAFTDAVRTGDKSLILSDYADAAKSFALSLAADQAVRENRTVCL